MKLKLTEKQIKDLIIQWLRLNNIRCRTITTSGIPDGKGKFRTNPNKGISDIIGTMRCGRSLYIEVKSESGKIRPDQALFLNEMLENDALAFVAKSLEDVVEKLDNCPCCVEYDCPLIGKCNKISEQ